MTVALSDSERKVLITLSAGHDEWCYNFRGIQQQTNLTRPEVQTACRSLREKGLARFVRGLFDPDEGRTAGSGYGATDEGYKVGCSLDEEGGAA